MRTCSSRDSPQARVRNNFPTRWLKSGSYSEDVPSAPTPQSIDIISHILQMDQLDISEAIIGIRLGLLSCESALSLPRRSISFVKSYAAF